LAKEFGVSRATVREALRVLAAQDLVKTAKGGGNGGSYISLPSAAHISDFLRANLNLLTATHDVSLDEFLEARELLEVAVVRMAAARRQESDLVDLREAIPRKPFDLSRREELDLNERFHTVLGDAAGNTLLNIAVHTVFTVLHTNLAQHSGLSTAVRTTIIREHEEILAAVERGNPDEAEAAMREHLAFLTPHYRKAWKHVKTERS
jgi:DNA-binding FadR family transcriptional regulator